MPQTSTKRIQRLMREIRKDHFARPNKVVTATEPVIYWEETSFGGEPFDVPLIILRTSPCRWFSEGGCTMCNYELMAIDEGVTPDDIAKQIENAGARLGTLASYKYIFLTSQGSFFDDREVDREARLDVASRLRALGVRSMATESEAKHCLDESKIRLFRETLGAPLSIGIGFEAFDPFVRDVIINKGLDTRTLERAAGCIARAGATFYTYVTLGKPSMSIEEDIADAVKAVDYSLELGATMVVLEMVNIQPYTLTHKLWQSGLYSPPSLWSGIECLQRISANRRASVALKGMEADIEPSPIALANSCDDCRDAVISHIRHWNYYRDERHLAGVWDLCQCHEEWRNDLRRLPDRSLTDRVDFNLGVVERACGMEG